MKRMKKKSYNETPDTPISRNSCLKQQNLAVHDRVELLQTVFSILKPREIKAMAPKAIRNLSLDSVKELCLDELLGISTKRLCAVIEGTSIPSDTESSSESELGDAAMLDLVSLESISSDEGVPDDDAPNSKKDVKPKHCKRRKHASKGNEKDKKKGKDKDKKVKPENPSSNAESSVGPTVLELLELQARARAIRAQLDKEQGNKKSSGEQSAPRPDAHADDSDDVEIKEEPQEIVELSSSDEDCKPDPAWLQVLSIKPAGTQTSKATEASSQTVTRRNDFTIIVPKSQTTRKIKLNRQKSTAVVTSSSTTQDIDASEKLPLSQIHKDAIANVAQTNATASDTQTEPMIAEEKIQKETKKKRKGKKKKKIPKKSKDVEESDHDEISLQLSDTEKMALLDDFKPRSRPVSCSSSADSESSSSSSDSHTSDDQCIHTKTLNVLVPNGEEQAKSTSLPENYKVESTEKHDVNDTALQENKVDDKDLDHDRVEDQISFSSNDITLNEKVPSMNDAAKIDDHQDILIESNEVVESRAENEKNHRSLRESTQDGDNIVNFAVQDTNKQEVDIRENKNADEAEQPVSQQDSVTESQEDIAKSQVDDVSEKDGLVNETTTELQAATVKRKKANKSKTKKKEKTSRKEKHNKN